MSLADLHFQLHNSMLPVENWLSKSNSSDFPENLDVLVVVSES